MKLRLAVLAVLTALVAALVVAPTVGAAGPTGSLTQAVTGTFTDATGGTGTFTGDMTITRFANQNGQLTAIGTVTGTLTDSLGNVLGTVTQAISTPVSASGTCDILHLTLGPLHLNVLGLVVDLNQVNLDITAQSGPGNLLGNLLCAVTHLLDGPASVNAIVALLNNLLGALG